MRVAVWVALLLSFAAPAQAEWQIKPFFGFKFKGGTNLSGDLELAAGKRKQVVGVTTTKIGEVVGLDVDVAFVPGFFEGDGFGQVIKSSVTTVTGNVTVGLPRRMTEYTLRPYFVGGAGLMRAKTTTTVPNVLSVSSNLPTFDLGGGVTGFITRRIGVSWELRHFSSLPSGQSELGSTRDALAQRLSFWRANMALAIRY